MHLYERPDLVSRSVIWDMQRRYYLGQGHAAWKSAPGAPLQMNANAFVARAYSEIILNFIRGCGGKDPVTVVEIGAGSGRLSYLLLKQLLRSYAGGDHRQPDPNFRYVMTDFAEAAIDAWDASKVFKPFIDQGVLRFALFDADKPRTAANFFSGGEGLRWDGPVVVIANNAADNLRQDVFRVSNGELLEVRAAVASDQERDMEDPDILKHVTLTQETGPVGYPYYEEPELDRMLREYSAAHEEATFSVPIGMIRCIRAFEGLSDGRFLALVGDKGCHSDGSQAGDPGPIPREGGISLCVNFEALCGWAAAQGNIHHVSNDADRRFLIAGICSDDAELSETRHVIGDIIGRFSPGDLSILLDDAEPERSDLSMRTMLALLRLAEFDSQILLKFRRRISELAEDAPLELRAQLKDCLGRVWEAHYPLDADRDVAYAIGRVLEALGDEAAAIGYYLRSVVERGAGAGNLFRLARCHEKLKDTVMATAYADKCLDADPNHSASEEMLDRLFAAQ